MTLKNAFLDQIYRSNDKNFFSSQEELKKALTSMISKKNAKGSDSESEEGLIMSQVVDKAALNSIELIFEVILEE